LCAAACELETEPAWVTATIIGASVLALAALVLFAALVRDAVV
jgi:hypothetical protein